MTVDPAELDRLAVAVTSAFAPIRPLVGRGRRISFNSRISVAKLGAAGGPFTVVAASLDDLGRSLAGLLDDTERCSVALARAASQIPQRHREVVLLGAGLERAGSPIGATMGITTFQAGAEAVWREYGDSLPMGDARRTLVDGCIRARRRLNGALAELSALAHALGASSENVTRLAHGHSAFLATSARIESVRLTRLDVDLQRMAEDIASYGQELVAALDAVGRRVQALVRAVDAVVGPIRSDLRSAA
jgi:hypothetical protein